MTQRKTQLDALAVTLLVACCFLWGLNQVAVKAAMPFSRAMNISRFNRWLPIPCR